MCARTVLLFRPFSPADGEYSITGGGTYDTPPLLSALLAVVKFLNGTSMAELGAGGEATQVSTGLVAYVVMEMTRYAQNQAAEALAAGSDGNTIGQVGDDLREMWQDCHEALKAACQSGKRRLELAGTVTFTHSRNLGIWRKLEHTMHQKDRTAAEKK